MSDLRHQNAGVTMIEMLVAVAIFALIGVAGFSVLDTIVRIDRRTDGRLAELARLDLTLGLFETDCNRATAFRFLDKDNALELTVADGTVTWQDRDSGLQRVVTRSGQPPLIQVLLPETDVTWKIANSGGVWRLPKNDVTGNAVALILGREQPVSKLAHLPQTLPQNLP